MIPLRNPAPPPQLTPEFFQEQTAVFVASGKAVWNLDFLKAALLEMGRNKCAYCEAILMEESKYLEVEHFHPKSRYKEQVLAWDNLLPACKRCNGIKRDHDVVAVPIINPRFVQPAEHLCFASPLLLSGKTALGQKTERVLRLNDHVMLIPVRVKLKDTIEKSLQGIQALLDDPDISPSASHRHAATNLLNLLQTVEERSSHAAFKATCLLQHPLFITISEALIQSNHWTNAHTAAEQAARDLALFP